VHVEQGGGGSAQGGEVHDGDDDQHSDGNKHGGDDEHGGTESGVRGDDLVDIGFGGRVGGRVPVEQGGGGSTQGVDRHRVDDEQDLDLDKDLDDDHDGHRTHHGHNLYHGDDAHHGLAQLQGHGVDSVGNHDRGGDRDQ